MGVTEEQEVAEAMEALVNAIPDREASWPLVTVALMQVKRNLGAIGKGTWNKDQKFWFRSADDVVNSLSPLCSEAGLLPIPEVLSYDATTYQTRSGSTWNMVRVRVRYTLVAEDGSKVSGVGFGEGADPGDKAANKAQTNAFKYFLCTLFMIPTGDVEADAEKPDEQAPPQENPQGRPEGRQQQGEQMPARSRRGGAERHTNAPTRRPNLSEENTAWNTPRSAQDVPMTGGQFADEASTDPPQDPPGAPGAALGSPNRASDASVGLQGKIDLSALGEAIGKLPANEASLETLRGYHNDVGSSVRNNLTDPVSGSSAQKLIKVQGERIKRRIEQAGASAPQQ